MAASRKQATTAQTKKYIEWISKGSPSPRPAEFDNTAFDGAVLWHISEDEVKAERVDPSTPVVTPVEKK